MLNITQTKHMPILVKSANWFLLYNLGFMPRVCVCMRGGSCSYKLFESPHRQYMGAVFVWIDPFRAVSPPFSSCIMGTERLKDSPNPWWCGNISLFINSFLINQKWTIRLRERQIFLFLKIFHLSMVYTFFFLMGLLGLPKPILAVDRWPVHHKGQTTKHAHIHTT